MELPPDAAPTLPHGETGSFLQATSLSGSADLLVLVETVHYIPRLLH